MMSPKIPPLLYRMRLAIGVKLRCQVLNSALRAWQWAAVAGKLHIKPPCRGATGLISTLCSQGQAGAQGMIFPHFRAKETSSKLVSGTEFFSPGATGISGLHSRLTRGVRPRLEGNEWTPLSPRVTTGIPWSPRMA